MNTLHDTAQRWVIQQWKYLLLLAALLGLIVVYPLVERGVLGARLFQVLLSIVLLAGLAAIGRRGLLLVLAAVLVLPTVVIRAAEAVMASDPAWMRTSSGTLSCAALLLVAGAILADILRCRRVTSDMIFASKS